MATVITRFIASTPERTASATWGKIMSLLAPDAKSDARAELEKVAGIAASSIVSEATKNDAFVISGSGPQVRIYCVFGEDAVNRDGVNESALKESATQGGWQLSIPCLPEDLDWSQKKLKADSKRATARATGEKFAVNESKVTATNSGLSVNMSEFLKS
jgi:hypothetical protein